ncbi:MAG: alkaline phosphatase family protein [Methanomicrobia archaeon]|nr:alkaline phosphatase family protein [Methanomicrobia archaeon]
MKKIIVFLLILIVSANSIRTETDTKVVLIILDGGYIDLNLGVIGECETVFPTLTRPNHASLVTGVYPDKHGILGNEYWKNGKKKYREIESVTIFEILKNYGKESVVIARKNICEFFGNYCECIIVDDPEDVFKTILEELQTKDFIFVNIPVLDSLGHKYGPHSKEVKDAEKELKNLFEKYEFDAVTIVTADHGMAEINKAIEITKYLQDYETIALSQGRVCFIYLEEDIDFHLEGIDQIIEKKDFPKYHIDHENAPDIILTAKEDYAFLPSPLLTEYRGMHGSFKENKVFITMNLGKGKIQCRTVDITPLILNIFGIDDTYDFDGEVPDITEEKTSIMPYFITAIILLGVGAFLLKRYMS